MSLLSDDDKALLVLEHLGPAALAGDTMNLYDCFHLALDVAEKAVLAKLAGAELPEPFPAGYIAQTEYFYTEENMREVAMIKFAQGHESGFAQGAAAQLAEKPIGFCRLSIDSKRIAHFDGKPLFMAGNQGNEMHSTPLYTQRNAK